MLRVKALPRALGSVRAAVAADRALLILCLIFVLSVPFITPYLRGDGNGYYAWLRSPVIDGDLNFADEFAHGDPAFLRAMGYTGGRFKKELYTPAGHIRNQWGTGAAVLWAPFFLLAHGLVLGSRALGATWAADGFSLPYRWITGFGTALYGFLGLLLAYRVARRFAGPGPALAGTVAVWGASSLLVYQYFLPFWAFAQLSFLAAALLTVWLGEGWGVKRWGAMGLLAGLSFSVHPTGIAWAALPAMALLTEPAPNLWLRSRAALWCGAGGFLALLPQAAGKAIVHGSPFDTGYREAMNFLSPGILRALFGADHGLISWTPIAGLALIGLGLLWRQHRRLSGGLLGVFALLLWVEAAHATHEQSSYGNRFFVAFTPGFVLGAAILAQRLWARRRSLAVAAVGLLVAWNLLFIFQWAWGLVPKRGPVNWGEMARNQVIEAPRELVQAMRLFITDRAAFIKTVQQIDEKEIGRGRP